MRNIFNLKNSICFLLSLFFVSITNSFGQAVVCPSVNAQVTTGASTTICQGSCAVLTATVPPVNSTTTYSVSQITFAPQSTVGATTINLTDDSQAGPFPIGFNFCFFGNNYSQFYIGSNGWISFSAGQSTAFSSIPIPSGAFGVPRNCIMGPWQDWNPGIIGGPYISYKTIGVAPCRALVVTWWNIPMFQCTTTYGRFQIIIYETTNIIENHLTNKPNCPSWAGGTAVQGIHNLPGTIGIPVPGRNSTQWTATNQGWRWTPTGPPTFTINWVGPTGPVGTGSQVTVCPLTTGIYTANATLGGCVGNTNVSGTVQVIVQPTPTISVSSASVCLGTGTTLVATGATSYTWQPVNIIGPSVSFTPITTTTYTVLGTTTLGCVGNGTATILVSPQPTANPISNSPVCQGSQLSFSVGAQSTYTWTGPNGFVSNLQNPIINPVTLAAMGNYTVGVTAPGGCTSQVVTSVTVNPSPTVTSTSGTVCLGFGTTLSASGANSYTWQPGNIIGSTATFTPASTTVYTVFGISNNGCISQSTSTILVNLPPVNTPGNNSPVCVGSAINFSTTTANNYLWIGPNSFTSTFQNPTIPNSSLLNSGTYTVILTSVAGCTQVSVTTVNVNPLPVLSTISSTTCAGINTTINVSGAITYTWSNGGVTPSIIVNPTVQTTYTVVGASAAGCLSSATATVFMTPPLVVNLTSNGPICVGGTLNLTSNIGTQWQWIGPNSFISNVQNPQIPSVGVSASGVYSVFVTNQQGCTGSSSINVIVNPLPIPQIISNSPVCANSSLQFNGVGGVQFSWQGPNWSSNNQNAQILSSSVNNSGTYTLTVTDANGCVKSTTTIATVNPLPTVSVNGATVCSGVGATLTANGGLTYSWQGPNFTSNQQNPQFTNCNSSMTGYYYVFVTDANGCANNGNTYLQVFPPFTVQVTNNSPICEGKTLTLTGPANYGYIWSGPNGFTSNFVSPSIYDVTTFATGVYTLVAIDAGGCLGSAVTNVVVNTNPVISITSKANKLCTPSCITFTLNSNQSLSNINWMFQNSTLYTSSTVQVCYNKGGVYTSTATVTDINGCIGKTTYSIEVYQTPVADFVFNPLAPIENDGVNFIDVSYGSQFDNWYWFFNSTGLNSQTQNPSYVYTEQGAYPVTLIVETTKGCKDTITKVVNVKEGWAIWIPNVFTPNGDGINDIFGPKGYGISKYTISIFDRWGEEVFTTTDFTQGWDGRVHRTSELFPICKDDVYTWLINLVNNQGKSHELKGHVTLIK
jgi:gliding motility-associated-like protein